MSTAFKVNLKSPVYCSYWVGDIFYIIKDIEDRNSQEDRREDIANLTLAGEQVGVYEYKGHKFFNLNTGGDGFWRIYEESNDGFKHSDTIMTDHGSVSIVPLELMSLITNFDPDDDLSCEESCQQDSDWKEGLEKYGPIIHPRCSEMVIQIAEENLLEFSACDVMSDEAFFYLPFNGLRQEWIGKYPSRIDK